MLNKYKLLAQICGLIALVLLGFGVGWSWQGARWESRYSERETEYAEARAAAERQARSEETRRAAAVEGIRRDARERIEQVEADAADADATAARLRDRVAELSRRPASCPATDAGGEAEPDEDKLRLGVVLAEMEEEGRRMARVADEARSAGMTCEEQYNSLQAADAH
ncbi:DUF2514 family protein [Halopseudomonas aestusnigri]|uniref:DUF2514 family protein n=1 Tax=Halopseudomonas aestusnigri TaxID=857252 RepID=UPI0028C18FC3|nr:hypothetical protein YSKK_13820 [Halopseudomonas aestusnigri]